MSRPGLAVGALLSLATLAWTALAGKDLSWDVLNHHYYIPFAWLQEGRVFSDFYGAGPGAYQNPLGYIPFYAPVAWNWPAWAVGATLALLHSSCAWCSWLIARRLWPDDVRWPFAATAFAWMCPAFLQVAGTSSSDPLAAALVLYGLWRLLSPTGIRSSLTAGLTLGLACTIKPTQAIFVFAAAALALWQMANRRRTILSLTACACGGVSGLLVGMGWHCWLLWRHFGNPFFPLFNSVFRSPLAPQGASTHDRFIPTGIADALLRPLYMADNAAGVYVEQAAPDLRPALALGVAALGIVLLLVSRLRERSFTTHRASGRWRAEDTDLILFVMVAWAGWLFLSGNGRYVLALLLLIGVLLVRWMWLALPGRVARSALLVAGIAQIAVFGSGGAFRNKAEPWDTAPYFDLEIPQVLRDTPYLHLTIRPQSLGSVAAFLAPEGALINIVGTMSLPVDGAVGAEVQRRLQAWDGKTRILFQNPGKGASSDPAFRTLVEELLWRLDVQVDWSDCKTITRHARRIAADGFAARLYPIAVNDGTATTYSSCRLDAGVLQSNRTSLRAEEQKVDAAYRELERYCPLLFSPAPLVSDRGVGGWQRNYVKSDLYVVASLTEGMIAAHARGGDVYYLGSVQEVAAGRVSLPCRRWTPALSLAPPYAE